MSESLVIRDQPGSPIFVVDSWPVLELIYLHEPALSRFLERLEAARQGNCRLLISRSSRGEIVYNVLGKRRRGLIPSHVRLDLDDLPWEVISVDDALVDEAADLKILYPISYADCFVAALAIRHGAPVITGDPDFLRLRDLGVLNVDWVGA